MAATVRLPTILREHAAGATTVEVEGSTVREVLRALDAAHPGVGRRVLDEQGSIRRHVAVYLGDERVRSMDAATPLGSEVTILAAVSGGSG